MAQIPFPGGAADQDVFFHEDKVCVYHKAINTWECRTVNSGGAEAGQPAAVTTQTVYTIPIPNVDINLRTQYDVNWFFADKIGENGANIDSIQLELDNLEGANNGSINVNAGAGLEATGANATANQQAATTRVLSAKTADGITIDGNGAIIIDPNFNLDGNITPPGDGKITINNSDGSTVGEFTVNQTGPTVITLPEVLVPDALHPSGFIDVSQPAPANPTHGDIYIQHRNDLADVVAVASFTGIEGQTVSDGQFVMFGVDDLWHAGGDAAPTEHQADWAQTDANAIDYIKNKPDLQAEVDNYAGNGAINVDAGPGLQASGSNATANQKNDTTRILSVKTADGITIDANGNIIIDPSFNLDSNITVPNDGVLTIKDYSGATVGTFTANQAGNTDVTLPEGFSGDYNDLSNQPTIGDGTLTISDSNGAVVGTFTANQTGNTSVALPKGFSGDYNDLTGKPTEFPPTSHGHAWGEITGKPCIYECDNYIQSRPELP